MLEKPRAPQPEPHPATSGSLGPQGQAALAVALRHSRGEGPAATGLGDLMSSYTRAPHRPRDRLLREETYRKGTAMIRPGNLPTLYHVNGFRVISCEIQKAGAVERDGQRLEYQVLKVFLEERPPTVPDVEDTEERS